MRIRGSLTSVIVLLAVLAPSEANSACLSHAQARAAYGYGLRWHGEGGRRCWGPAKSSRPKTARSFSSEVKHQLVPDPPPIAEGGLYPTWVFEERRGVNSQEFTPRRLDDNLSQVASHSVTQASAEGFPVSVAGILLILLTSGLLTAYKLGKEAWGHYASRRVPGDRIGGSRSRDRLLWLLLGQELGGRCPDTRPPHPPWPGAGELKAQGGGQQR